MYIIIKTEEEKNIWKYKTMKKYILFILTIRNLFLSNDYSYYERRV